MSRAEEITYRGKPSLINMNDLLFVFWCLLDTENDIIDLDNFIRSFPIALELRSPSFHSARIIQPNFLLFLKVDMSGYSVIGCLACLEERNMFFRTDW